MALLTEHNSFESAGIELVESATPSGSKKLIMKGIFLQADVRNHNRRVYPLKEITKAVNEVNERIRTLGPVPGECEHPEGLDINIERISHTISDMWMEGNNGMGKLTLLSTPLGNITRTLLESGVKLGVSSRGAGDIDDFGNVSDYNIITVDIVSTPSAPDAYPTTIYEKLIQANNSKEITKLAEAVSYDNAAQKYFQQEIMTWMDNAFTIRRKK